jgi:hypothetical protein
LSFGTQDIRSRDKLLHEHPVPNLARCIEVLKAAELSNQHRFASPLSTEREVHAFGQKQGQHRHKQPARHARKGGEREKDERSTGKGGKPEKAGNSYNRQVRDCTYCGMTHTKGQCMAYGKTCAACGAKNHFAVVCLTSKHRGNRKLHQNDAESRSVPESAVDSEDSTFFNQRIGAVNGSSKKSSEFKVDMSFYSSYTTVKQGNWTQELLAAQCRSATYTI